MVILPQTMEDSEYMDTCTMCGDKGMYDSPSLSEDIWKKFDLDLECNKIDTSYPTPPSSPQHEFCSDTEDVLKNNLHNLDDESLSRTFIGITTDLDNIQCNLIQDCMWSAPGLVAAGLLPGESVKSKTEPTVDENSNNISPSKKVSQLDINTKDCVDPAAVFPCSSRNNSPTPALPALSQSQDSGYDLGLDTPSASSDNESDDEEIDVVNVQTERNHPSIRRHHSHPASSSTCGSSVQRPTTLTLTVRREPTLPAATSMSAQVAAMHNYSSCTGSSHHHHHKSSSSASSSSSYKSYHSYSSPHTPSGGSSTSSHKRLRPYSSPASPQSSSSSKRQKMVVSENDLKSVVRKLTGRRSHHQQVPQVSSPPHHSNHNSRSSSDYEDNSDIGKRAYHNVLERRRRDDLRTSFHLLRERVPEIESNERAPKMMILNKSTEYITELTRTHQNLVSELQRQKQHHEQLKKKLTLLRKEAL